MNDIDLTQFPWAGHLNAVEAHVTAVLERAAANETDQLLRDVYAAALRTCERNGGPHPGSVVGNIVLLAERDHPEPSPPGIDPYGTPPLLGLERSEQATGQRIP